MHFQLLTTFLVTSLLSGSVLSAPVQVADIKVGGVYSVHRRSFFSLGHSHLIQKLPAGNSFPVVILGGTHKSQKNNHYLRVAVMSTAFSADTPKKPLKNYISPGSISGTRIPPIVERYSISMIVNLILMSDLEPCGDLAGVSMSTEGFDKLLRDMRPDKSHNLLVRLGNIYSLPGRYISLLPFPASMMEGTMFSVVALKYLGAASDEVEVAMISPVSEHGRTQPSAARPLENYVSTLSMHQQYEIPMISRSIRMNKFQKRPESPLKEVVISQPNIDRLRGDIERVQLLAKVHVNAGTMPPPSFGSTTPGVASRQQ